MAALLISLFSVAPAFAQAITTTTVRSSVNPATYPQSETLTATVTSSSTVNEATVTFQSDGSTISGCGAQPVTSGTATCTTLLTTGSHSIQALYNGDSNFGPSSSATLTQTVNSPVSATAAVSNVTLTQNASVGGGFTPVTGSGGTGTLSYSILPTLPASLNFNAATGAITGTPNASAIITTYTVTVTDSNGRSASNSFLMNINAAVTATQSVYSATVTQNHAITSFTPITGGGGTAPLSYSISPTLPAGLTLASSTGVVSGTPTTALATTTFTVTVTDSNGGMASNTFSLTVNGPVTATQVIASKSLTLNFAVTSFTPVTGAGGTGALSYSVSPTLPPGIAMAPSSGAITGLPTAPVGATTYTVTVTDQNGGTATATFSLAVNGGLSASTAIATTTLTQNHAATPFTPVTGSGGTSPLTYAVTPTLPAGLTMASATGTITGTPTSAQAASSYTVTVTDINGATATAGFSLTVNGGVTATTAIATATLTQNHAATPFTPVTGAGGNGALTYTVSPTLPAGLTMASATGTITGTPTSAQAASSYTVTVTDLNGATATAGFSLTVDGGVTATTAVASTVLTINHAATSFTPVAGAGGTGALTYTVSPTLPGGLSMAPATGAITGTPTVTSAAATYTVTVTDANAATATATFSLSVATSATTVALASSQNPSSFGQAVTFSATVSGGGGTPGGTVTFNDGGTVIGTAALSGGVAALTVSTLKAGTHTITAAYGGNSSYNPSTSPALTQTVNVPADSIKLRALQVNVTKVVAQASGQAISGAIDNAIADGFAGGGALLTQSGAGFHYNFAADPDQQAGSEGNAAPAGARGTLFGGMGNASGASGNSPTGQRGGRIDDAFAALAPQTPAKAPPKTYREERDWMLWADVRGSGLDRITSTPTAAGVTTAAAPLYGFQINALMGLSYRVRPNVLVGVFGGYETFNYTEQDINGKLTGDGWTVGAYLGWKLAPMLRYDAAVAYSGIGYNGIAGAAQGNFDGRRWMVSTGLTGAFKTMGLEIEPSAKVYVLWENEGAYVDSLGTQQASHDFSTGRASAGAKVTYPIAWSDAVALAPFVGVYADYYFDQSNSDAIVSAGGVPLASTPLLAGWSARVTGGLGARFASGASIGAGAEYGGIGSGFEIWTFTAKARVPF